MYRLTYGFLTQNYKTPIKFIIDQNKLRRPGVKPMITVDNRSANMTLTNELKISFLSFWPLAMSLIKPNVRQHPATGGVMRQHSKFLNRLTTESLFFSASAPLFVETQVRIYL